MNYSHLLFDLDGTIFDYDRAESEALKRTFSEFGIRYLHSSLAAYRKINRQIWKDYESGMITQSDLKRERFRRLGEALAIEIVPDQFGACYLNYLSQGRFLIPGVLGLLNGLRRDGYKMYIITNGLKDVQRARLNGSEITGFFSDIFISGEIGSAKPDRAIFDEAFGRMGAPDRRKVLLIGDSLSSDIAGGSAYGMDTCWYNPDRAENRSGHTPVFVIHDIRELSVLLEP